MSYWANHIMGESEIEIPFDSLPSLYNELSQASEEHTDVSVTHGSEWCLSVFKTGLIVWENVAGEGEPKHMKNITREKAILLWQELAKGNIAEVDKENWAQGYGQ